ncbi:uncharacterized protein ARMOST_14203 [Armillaria ostoyae]|uniref:Uncharacterized protein n=1 Tax=Armillaria ostoyae TaxID=47428 RepID=A0A284RPX6_ARMOS|nr:uncharacterized protein ARMOST_14203 [Armillaria ostoyae]
MCIANNFEAGECGHGRSEPLTRSKAPGILKAVICIYGSGVKLRKRRTRPSKMVIRLSRNANIDDSRDSHAEPWGSAA